MILAFYIVFLIIPKNFTFGVTIDMHKPFLNLSSFFLDMLKNVYRHFYIICENEKCRKIGFIYCYNAHMSDGYVYTTAFLINEYRKTLYGAEAGLLYYAHLFRYFNYRKIYSEVYSYNEESKSFLESASFEIEGILKEHRYYLDKFHDLYIFSINRDFFFKKFGNLIQHFSSAIME